MTSARSALEESVVLRARTGFLRSGISEQVKILRRVRGGIENVYKDGQRDFKVRSVTIVVVEGAKLIGSLADGYSNSGCSQFEARIDDGHITSYNG